MMTPEVLALLASAEAFIFASPPWRRMMEGWRNPAEILTEYNEENLMRALPQNSNDLERMVFLAQLKRAQHNINVVSDGLNPSVYTEEVAHRIEARLDPSRGKNDLSVKILVGPTIYFYEDEGKNLLWELCERARNRNSPLYEKLQLRVLRENPKQYFQVVDGKELWLREPGGRCKHFWCSFTNARAFTWEFNRVWPTVMFDRRPELQVLTRQGKMSFDPDLIRRTRQLIDEIQFYPPFSPQLLRMSR